MVISTESKNSATTPPNPPLAYLMSKFTFEQARTNAVNTWSSGLITAQRRDLTIKQITSDEQRTLAERNFAVQKSRRPTNHFEHPSARRNLQITLRYGLQLVDF